MRRSFFTEIISKILKKIIAGIFPPRDTELIVQHAEFSSLRALLKPELIKIETQTIHSPLSYHSPLVQAFILEAKFHNNRKAQGFLGRILGEYLAKHMAKLQQKDELGNSAGFALVPLPLGKKRRKERGYNKVEEIAKFAHIEEFGGILAPALLMRIRETAHRLRFEEMRACRTWKVLSRPLSLLIQKLPYILLDDVATTGATLLAAREALERVGAKRVITLALAH